MSFIRKEKGNARERVSYIMREKGNSCNGERVICLHAFLLTKQFTKQFVYRYNDDSTDSDGSTESSAKGSSSISNFIETQFRKRRKASNQ